MKKRDEINFEQIIYKALIVKYLLKIEAIYPLFEQDRKAGINEPSQYYEIAHVSF